MNARLTGPCSPTLLCVALGLTASIAGAQAGPWGEHPVAAPSATLSVQCVDLDGDGDADLLHTHQWFENQSRGTNWSGHPIADAVTLAVDLDRDGDADALGSGPLEVYWLENVNGDGSAFPPRTIGFPATFLFDTVLQAGDLDGDGDVDVVLAESGQSGITWFENANGDQTLWIPHTLSLATDSPSSLDLADVDGDGDVDLLSGDQAGYWWYENPLDRSATWARQPIRPSADPKPRRVRAGDLDGDGDQDALFASQGDMSKSDAVGWFENTSGKGSLWTLELVAFDDAPASSSYLAAPVDLDQDGDLDFLQGFLGGLAWFENRDGAARSFVGHLLDTAMPAALNVRADAADLDRDGDLDVAEVQGSTLVADASWLENETPVTPYGGELDPPGSLRLVSGAVAIGQPLVFALENPLGTQRRGTHTFLALSTSPAPGFPGGIVLPGFGMAGPGASGERLIAVGAGNPFARFVGTPLGGPERRGFVSTRIPANVALVGLTFYAQGLLLDPGSTGVRLGLTNGLRATIGP